MVQRVRVYNTVCMTGTAGYNDTSLCRNEFTFGSRILMGHAAWLSWIAFVDRTDKLREIFKDLRMLQQSKSAKLFLNLRLMKE